MAWRIQNGSHLRLARLTAVAAVVALAVSSCSSGGTSSTSGTSTSIGSTGDDAPVTPPQIPENFTWSGRYVVPSLGLDVPFTWHGRDGSFQMTAGNDGDPIHFTNLIYDSTLYTLTYAWPDIPRLPCSNVGPFTLAQVNEGLKGAHFVGPETLEGPQPARVNHFRANVAVDLPPGLVPLPEGVPVRLPIMSGDFYVDRADPTRLHKLLHFGLQNIYASDLDEWIVIEAASDEPGEVNLPNECATATPPSSSPPTTN